MSLLPLVERYLRAYNARDWDAWIALFDKDVEVAADIGVMHGQAAVRAFAEATVNAFPGVRAVLDRIVADTGERIVAEYRLENPDGEGWHLAGTVCDIYDVRDGLIVKVRSYYLTSGEADTTASVPVPGRMEGVRIAEEQAALRRVATLVARGASEAETFAAVTEQASRLLGDRPALLLRRDDDGGSTIVSVHGGPARAGDRVVRAPIVVGGKVWGEIAADAPDDADTQERLAQFAELVVTSIANAESRAELTRSRARVVAAADETRRRIQRDLHDGAQQRLVQSIITLKLAKAEPSPELIDEALGHASRAMSDLRELVHGIMPAALTRGGLRAGVETLLDRVALPVTVDVEPGRMPERVETTAYFAIAEALTNAVKHAGATGAQVRAAKHDSDLIVEVRDNGAGGADLERGSGLLGLADRVAACGGTLTLESPSGGGTTLTVTLPL